MTHENVIATETIATDAGDYLVKFIVDDYPDAPYNDGLGFAFAGGRNTIDVATGDHSDEALSLVKYHRRENAYNGNIYDSEIRSAAAIARYLRIKYGLKGIREVSQDYYTSEPSSDRNEGFHGLAWAPDDAGDPERYTDYGIAEYRAWAEGDVFGYVVTGPDDEELEDGSCWGFYGFDESRSYALEQATDAANYDAEERIEKTNLVGAGFVGLI